MGNISQKLASFWRYCPDISRRYVPANCTQIFIFNGLFQGRCLIKCNLFPENMAHFYERKAKGYGKKLLYDEAINCHSCALAELEKALKYTDNSRAIQSIKLQMEFNKSQKDYLKWKKLQHQAYLKAVKMQKEEGQGLWQNNCFLRRIKKMNPFKSCGARRSKKVEGQNLHGHRHRSTCSDSRARRMLSSPVRVPVADDENFRTMGFIESKYSPHVKDDGSFTYRSKPSNKSVLYISPCSGWPFRAFPYDEAGVIFIGPHTSVIAG